METSKPYSWNLNDFTKGLLLAVITVVIGSVQQALTAHGFDFAAYDWAAITNVAITAFIAYLAKNFVQDKEGTPFGTAK